MVLDQNRVVRCLHRRGKTIYVTQDTPHGPKSYPDPRDTSSHIKYIRHVWTSQEGSHGSSTGQLGFAPALERPRHTMVRWRPAQDQFDHRESSIPVDQGVRLTVQMFLLITSMSNGYDGSMMNGLQTLENWREYFDNPTGGTLGLFNAIQVSRTVI